MGQGEVLRTGEVRDGIVNIPAKSGELEPGHELVALAGEEDVVAGVPDDAGADGTLEELAAFGHKRGRSIGVGIDVDLLEAIVSDHVGEFADGLPQGDERTRVGLLKLVAEERKIAVVGLGREGDPVTEGPGSVIEMLASVVWEPA